MALRVARNARVEGAMVGSVEQDGFWCVRRHAGRGLWQIQALEQANVTLETVSRNSTAQRPCTAPQVV